MVDQVASVVAEGLTMYGDAAAHHVLRGYRDHLPVSTPFEESLMERRGGGGDMKTSVDKGYLISMGAIYESFVRS